jgi:predicted alpha/beta-hydrolase family hydrolase
MTETAEVATPVGPARVHLHPAASPVATLVLGHGAGGGVGAPDLAALAASLPGRGVTVVLVEQPWRVAGRRRATLPPTLDVAWLAVLEALALSPPVFSGGRSAGARVACRTAVATGAAGVLALAFPLHPPGRLDRSRAGELLAAGVPTLVVQGDRDAFGGPADLPSGPDVARVPWADHSFGVPAAAPLTRREALGIVVTAAGDWLADQVGNRGTRSRR